MHSSNPINPFIFPFIPHEEDQDSLFHQHIHEYLLNHHHQPPPVAAANPQPPSQEEHQDQNVRSNSTKKNKKDRHSKITTAKGPRDRRMRLSIDIARRFFDLQDLLGFEKASSTVEWLLSKSREAIHELSIGSTGFVDRIIGSANSTTSECEVASKLSGNVAKERKSSSNFPRKPVYNLKMAKESRKAARERAKERTREKIRSSFFNHDQVMRPMMNNIVDATSPINHLHLELQILQDPSSSNSIIFNYEFDDEHHQNPHGISQLQNYEDWDCCQNMGALQQHIPMLTYMV